MQNRTKCTRTVCFVSPDAVLMLDVPGTSELQYLDVPGISDLKHLCLEIAVWSISKYLVC